MQVPTVKRKLTQPSLAAFADNTKRAMTAAAAPAAFAGSAPAPKKLVIKAFKVKPSVPDSFVSDSLERLRRATTAVLGSDTNSSHPNDSLEGLYKTAEHLCIHGKGGEVYDMLRSVCASHTENVLANLAALELQQTELLHALNEAWLAHCRAQLMIRSIFLYLDRTHVIQTAGLKSIWDMGLDLFRANFLGDGSENSSSPSFKTRVVDAILKTIENERRGQQIQSTLLKSILQMFLDLGIYMSVFEGRYLSSTESFYLTESKTIISEMGDGASSGPAVGAYLEHAEKRLEEEKARCGGGAGVAGYLSVATKKGATAIAERVLVESQVLLLLQRGFDNLIQEDRVADLGRMYSLFSKVPSGLAEMRKFFGDYIVKVGLSIVNDVARDSTMVSDLLTFRKKMDHFSVHSFSSNKEFVQAVRDSFEKFINKRANKPAELIAKHVDSLMKSGKGISEDETEDVLDQCLALFRFIHGKDVFEAFYKKDLAKRLLLGKSSSVDSEKSMLSKLKVECGAGFTSKLESMFKDIETSKDIVASFRQSKRLVDQIGSIDMYVNFLTSGMWPTYPPAPLTIPAELQRCQDIYHEFYMSKHNGRRLTWQNQLGHCVLKGYFKKANKEISVSLFQAVVLLLFNEKITLTYKEIAAATSMEAKELERTLQSLACGKTRVLTKNPKGRDINTTDSFDFNESFENPLFRIKINSIQLKETVEENKDTTEKVFADRQYAVDAAIVRIMKTRKKLTHTLLIAELFEQLKFPIKAQDLKKRIESLIDREYLEREKNDSSTYIYLA